RSSPLLIELIPFFLLDAVVTRNVKPLAVVRFQIRIGRFSAKTSEVCVEVIFCNDQGISDIGMGIEALGHEHVGAQVYRTPPEPGQKLALNFEMLYVLRVPRRRYRRNLLVENDGNRLRRGTHRNLARRRIQVSGRQVPVLPLATIHGELEGVSIAAMKGLVAVQDDLQIVVARLNLSQTAHGIARCRLIEHHGLPGPHPFNVHAEYHLGPGRIVDLHSWLCRRIVREQQQQATINRLIAPGLRKGYGKSRCPRLRHTRAAEAQTENAHEYYGAGPCRHSTSCGRPKFQVSECRYIVTSQSCVFLPLSLSQGSWLCACCSRRSVRHNESPSAPPL